MKDNSKVPGTIVAIVAICAGISIPLASILAPVMAKLIPLLYIIVVSGIVTLCARHLLAYQHRLRLEEIEQRKELAMADARRFREADRLLAEEDPIDKKVAEITAREKEEEERLGRAD